MDEKEPYFLVEFAYLLIKSSNASSSNLDIASISIENQFVMDTDYAALWFLHSTVQNKVLDWCYQISKTPLEERD